MSDICVLCEELVRPLQHGVNCGKCNRRQHRTYETGWHRRLDGKAGRGALPMYVLLKLLLQEAKLVNIQHQLVTEDAVRRHQRAIYKVMDDKIVVLWEAYDHREIVCEDFLSGIADVYCM